MVDIKTEKQMRVGELLINGKYRCYSSGMLVGEFAPDEIESFERFYEK